MTREDRQEHLSLAYIKALAANAGMTYSSRSKDYGIDITLHEVQKRGLRFFETGLHLDLQVKSTSTATLTQAHVTYDLDIKNYDDLRFETDQPRLLVLMVLPPDERRWLHPTETRLEIRKCLYWASFRGRPAVLNRSSIRVAIPRRHLFTDETIRGIMEKIRVGEEI